MHYLGPGRLRALRCKFGFLFGAISPLKIPTFHTPCIGLAYWFSSLFVIMVNSAKKPKNAPALNTELGSVITPWLIGRNKTIHFVYKCTKNVIKNTHYLPLLSAFLLTHSRWPLSINWIITLFMLSRWSTIHWRPYIMARLELLSQE
jgi:hypothetical protein